MRTGREAGSNYEAQGWMMFDQRHYALSLPVLALLAGAVLADSPTAPADRGRITFDIASQPLADALTDFADQASLHVMFAADAPRGAIAPAIKGAYAPLDALLKLLEGSDLDFVYDGRQSVAIRPVNGDAPVSRPVAMAHVADQPMVAAVSDGAAEQTRLAQAESDASSAAAAAPARQEGMLEEVIVTATKRGPTLLKDTAISIRAIGENVLTAKDVQVFSDWAPLVPGLIAEDQGPGEKRYVIRGVRSVGPSTVGVYLDDAVISGFNTEDDGGGRNVDIRLYDIERIEVLRGPQGTLYGAGSLSGTIRYITHKPDPQSAYGKLSGTISSTESGGTNYRTNGHVNVPLSENFALRAVGWYEDEDGFIDNVRLGINDVNDQETTGGRLAARWVVSDALEFNASAVIQRTELGGKQRFYPLIGDLQTDEFVVDIYEDDADVYQASMTYQFDAGTVHASTAWFDRDVFYRFDSTPILLFFGVPLPFAIAVTDQPEQRQLWSNEIRYSSDFDGPVQVLVGAFYSKLDRDFASNVISATEDGVPTGTEPDIFGRISSFEIDEFALFGELSYEFSERWTGVVGLRWFDFQQDSQSMETLPFGGFDPGDEPQPDPDRSASASDLAVKLSLSYRLSDEATLYGLYSEGFRQGGTNSTGFGAQIIIPESFESDSVKNFEFGAKTLWWDNRLAFNAAIYTIDWSDIQTLEQEPVQGFPFIGNAGTARVDGIELEFFAQPVDRWNFVASASFIDARLTEDQPALEVETPVGNDGDPIPYVPDFTGALSVQYDFPIAGGWNGFVRADWNYVGDSQTQFNRNGQFFQEQEAYDVLDLRLLAGNGSWEVALFLDNVFDERAEITVLETTAVPLSVFTNRPRTVGATVNFLF